MIEEMNKEIIEREQHNQKRIMELNKEIKRLKEEYVMLQNASSEVEEEKDKEIERLNNIINELEKWLVEDLKEKYRDAGHRHNIMLEVLDKIKELKGSDKE